MTFKMGEINQTEYAENLHNLAVILKKEFPAYGIVSKIVSEKDSKDKNIEIFREFTHIACDNLKHLTEEEIAKWHGQECFIFAEKTIRYDQENKKILDQQFYFCNFTPLDYLRNKKNKS